MKKKIRILIVEDSEDDTLLEVHLIKKSGYDVYHERVETAEDMNNALNDKKWDIILSDYAMPHFSGLEALSLLKESGLDIPFIIISGTIGEEIAVEAMRAGAQDYLMKNNLRRLLPAIERELKEAKSRAEIKLLEQKKKQAEESLRESEERYRLIAENTADTITILDLDLNIIYVSPSVKKLRGYSVQETTSQTIDQFLTPESLIKARNILADQMELEKRKNSDPFRSVLFELEEIHKNGSIIQAELSVSFIRDENLNPVRILVVSRDITMRKQAEEKLKVLSYTVEQSPVMILITDTEGNIEYVNPMFEEVIGYSMPEVIGKKPNIIKSGKMPDKLYKEMREAIKSHNIWQGELINKKRNGDFFWAKLSISPLKDNEGNVTHFVSIQEDITERKKSEEKLHLLNKALEASANSIVITNRDAKIIWANDAFSKLTGYSLDEVIGKNPRELIYSGIQSKEFYQDMWETILSGSVWNGEIINKRKDGSIFNEFLTITPVKDDKNVIQHFVAVKQDISDQKKAEEELRKAKEKAEESNKLKSAFLATMNHELRTPLNHILGFSDLMRTGAELENVAEYSDIIYKSSENLLEIIEDIFDLSLAEQSEIKLRLQTFKCLDLFLYNKSVLNEILELSGKTDQIKLGFNADKELLLQNITTDRTKINQVLLNLFKNAVKFTRSGKIEFGLKKGIPGEIIFYVEDTGIGIPEDQQEIVFDFFRQADDSDTREFGGVGIGLAISQRIAEVMNGGLSLKSLPGKGSTFYFNIPVTIPVFIDYHTNSDSQEISVPNFLGKTIMIAEDDPDSTELLRIYLSNTDAKLIEVTNGKEVVEKLKLNPDAILMDLNMPIFDGYSATQEVKSMRPDIPVIAVTAYALPKDQNKAKEAGCDGIISKPVNRSILYEELKKHLHLD